MSAIAVASMPDWPAGMTRDLALAYTGVAEAQLREWEQRGLVRFCPRGPRGAAIAARKSLDAALSTLFSLTALDESAIEFD
jgi:hypothetical protein